MKYAALLVIFTLPTFAANADSSIPEVQFSQDSPLPAVVESMPGSNVEVPWLEGVIVRQVSGPVDDKSMSNSREVFERWCKVKGASIVQPRQHNCAPLSGGYLGCAVGELLRFSRTDIEAGLVQLAKKNNSSLTAGWQHGSWIISNNLIGTLFFKSMEKSVVGELQRCVRADGSIVAAMIYASIDKNDDFLFLTDDRFMSISAIGKEWNQEMAERKRLADEQKVAAKKAAIEALKPGDTVVRKRESWKRGMVVEVKSPLVQVQWKDDYSGKTSIEWVKLDDLDFPPRH